eukprot:8202636-Pyramimonas_sp.AAC.1
MAIRSEKNARMQTSFVFFKLLKGFGLLEASLGSDLASWSRLGVVLGSLRASSYRDGGYLGPSEALLEPPGAKKYPLTPRRASRPGPGRG